MSLSNRTRTLSFVAFASLAALTGCTSGPSAGRGLAGRISDAPLARLDVPELRTPAAPAPASRVLPERASLVVLDSPAQAAVSQLAIPHGLAAQLTPVSSPRLALGGQLAQRPSLEASPTLVVGTDVCETDDDCVPDGCHATSCVAAAEMDSGELACTTDFRFGTTDGGGCLCHVGHCAALLSALPQGI